MFQQLGAEVRPIQICVGTLKGSWGPLQSSKHDPENPNKTIYSYNELAIRGYHGAPEIKLRLLWLPAWFDPRFSTRTLDAKQEMVYGRLIGTQGGTTLGDSGLLRGLCGDETSWVDLQKHVEALGTYDADSVDDLLRDFFRSLGPVPFLYELRQERKKAGVDERGKQLYVRGKFLEVSAIEHITQRTVASLAKRLAKNRKRIADALEANEEPPVALIAKFDPAEYGFDDVAFPVDAEPGWVAA